MLYNREVKKEREFSNLSGVLELSKVKPSIIANNFFLTEVPKPAGATQHSKNRQSLGSKPAEAKSIASFQQEGSKEGSKKKKEKSKEKLKTKKDSNLAIFVEYFAYYKKNGSKP